ncbi:MAG: DUF2314 domain-containing protein [Burkholderiaceae bacterium]|nr:DUF2314 domain-containing protein [Burkholderiaceae bacterium]
MKIFFSRFLLRLGFSLLLIGFFSSAWAASKFFPTGSPAAESVYFQLAVYYAPLPSQDPTDIFKKLASQYKLNVVATLSDKPSDDMVTGFLEKDVLKNYAPLSPSSLRYFGLGLSKEQAENLQRSKQVFIINFAHPQKHALEALKKANQLVESLARQTNGLVWDEETRQIFTPDAWQNRRVETWATPFPNAGSQITIHVYKDREYVRAITLGMKKLGLPDVVVEQFSWSMNKPIGNLINAFCQVMVEGSEFKNTSLYELNLMAIQNSKVKEQQTTDLKPNAVSIVKLQLYEAVRAEGDPNNRLVELGFDRYTGNDLHAKQEALLGALYGTEDSIKYIKHTDELLMASQKAKNRLPELKTQFNSSFAPGEFLQLKAPFVTDIKSNEWMWVEVTEWKSKRIKGLLKNEPFHIKSLHAGQIVEINQDDVFDFIHTFPDGRTEGNETSKIIMKLNDQKTQNK